MGGTILWAGLCKSGASMLSTMVDVTSSLGLLPPDFAWTIAQTVGLVESSYLKLLLSQQQGRHRL